MSEQTLMLVLLGVLALSWAVIAVVVGGVGWQVYKILRNAQGVTEALQVRLKKFLRR